MASIRLSPMIRRATLRRRHRRARSARSCPQARHGSSPHCRRACRRNRRWRAGSFVTPDHFLAWRSTMSSRPARALPVDGGSEIRSPFLCWLNLRVPRMSLRIDLETDDRSGHGFELRSGPSCARVHGLSGEMTPLPFRRSGNREARPAPRSSTPTRWPSRFPQLRNAKSAPDRSTRTNSRCGRLRGPVTLIERRAGPST